MIETLDQLVKRLGLKPSTEELELGRTQNEDGTSYVIIRTENGERVYTTLKGFIPYDSHEVKN